MTFWGTCGIRKIFHPHAEGFTPELALNLGLSLGTYVNGGVVVVGKDIRTAALPIEFALTSGLVSVGCHVLRIGLATTPTLAFATGELNAQAGVMITASHNTPDYIGVKFWQPSGLGFNTDQENEIEEIFNGRAYRPTHWNEIGTVVDVADFNSRHVTEIMKQVNVDPDGKHFSVVVDPGNGAACEIAPMLLKELYCRITTMNAQPDGYFPGRYSEPSRENLKMVSEFIRSAGGEIELGIALDGDGDRVIFIDEKGALVDPIRLMTLLTLSIAKGLPDDLRYGFSVAAPINSSSVLEDTIKPFGAKVVYTQVGDIKVAQALKQVGSLLGGESSGTYVWPDFHFGPDSLLTIAKIIEIMQREEKPLSELMASIPDYPYLNRDINAPDGQQVEGVRWEFLKHKIIEHYQDDSDEVRKVTEIDGVRLDCRDCWILIRPSGTTPVVRLTVESRKDTTHASKVLEEAEEFLTALLNE